MHVVNLLVLVTALIAVYQMRQNSTSVTTRYDSYNNESIGCHVGLHDVGSFTFGSGLCVQS